MKEWMNQKYRVINVFLKHKEIFVNVIKGDDGDSVILTRKMAHKICPEALLLLYESRLEFPEEETKRSFFFSQNNK